MFIPLILLAALGTALENAAAVVRKAVLCAITIWAWIYLPIAVDLFWYRGGILKAGVVTHGIVAALVTVATAVTILQKERSTPPQAPSELPGAHMGCYQHPHQETGISCTRCERRICPDCMVSAPIGFHCPPCALDARWERRRT
jgi:hypothetical protein